MAKFGEDAPSHLDLGAPDSRVFELLVQGVIDYAIYMLDPDGHIVTWNAGARRLKGYDDAEIIGRHFSRFFTEEDKSRGLPTAALETARRLGRVEAEGWRVRKDGTRFWASAVIDAIYDESGSFVGFAKITRDISQQRAAQQALVESERRFRLLTQGIIDYAICMLDPSGIITNWNAGAERMKGYRAEEIVGRHFSVFYTPEERGGGMAARALQIARHEGRFESEGWRLRQDGTRFFASVVIDAIRDEKGDLIGFAKITRDITQRRKDDDRLRESERQFRLLINSVTDYALYMLDLNGTVTSWNAGAERIKGYTAQEIIGDHFSRFYAEADRAAGVPARALATAAETGRFEAEGWRVRKDGSFLWASVVIDAIRDESGRLVGFAKITRDISERREAQLSMQKMQAQLAESQKMEALGQLTGGVAHDFNNLLMIISGHIGTLRKIAGDNPKAVRAAEAVQIAAQRGAALTKQLLSFSRRQRVNPSAVSVAEQAVAFREVLTSAVGSNIRVILDIPATTWPVKVDANEFEIALVNLVLNARDAMPEGGVVTIIAENVDLPRSDLALTGEHVALTVADTGLGIAPDVLGRIFDPFFTTKAAGKGTGLGLSQVFGFAHQAGGTVKAESTLGRGTRITLWLPRAKKFPAAAANVPAPASAGGISRVLLVEDNPDVATATTELLEQLGYEVRPVADAASALALLDSGETVDLVVSDIVMPGSMDGLTLARALRTKFPRLPVLLATGYSEAALNVRDEYPILYKPYGLQELGSAISNLARNQGGINLLQFPQKRANDQQNGR